MTNVHQQSDNIKRWVIITFVLFVIGFYFMNVTASGDSGTELRQLDAFERIEVGGLVNVILHEGDEYKADIDVSGMPLEDIVTQVEDGTLVVTSEGFHSGESIEIHVTHQGITAVKTSGTATITTEDTLKTTTLSISITGSGDAELDVDVDVLNIAMSGNGNLTVEGEAKQHTLTSSGGGGSFDNGGLSIED